MRWASRISLIGLCCAGCSDSATVVESAGTSSGETTSTTASATSAEPTTSGTTATSIADGSSEAGSSTSGAATTTVDEPTTSTGGESTTEPPHVTDFRLCDIAVTCDQTIVDEPKRSCNVTVTEADGYVVYDGPGGLENRGRSSQTWPKHQYGLELWEHPNLELVSPGSTWRYDDGPSQGGALWMTLGFDDSAWSEGPAPLGYGVLGPEQWATVAQIPNATVIGYGPDPSNKYITSRYRHAFEIVDVAALDPVVLNLRADDGAIVYVNGAEVARWNMPSGPIDPATPASATVDSLEEIEFANFFGAGRPAGRRHQRGRGRGPPGHGRVV